MRFFEIFILIIFSVPIYGLLIWSYIEPEESFFLGRRWMYGKEPELSEGAIKFHKTMSIVSIIVVTIILLLSIFR